jgi:general stress protein 26
MDELTSITLDLMKRAPVAYLATVDADGLPQVRAVENLRCTKKFPHPSEMISRLEEDPLISYLSINTSSNKLRQVGINPVVALYYCVPDEYKGVMLRGKAEVLDDLEFKKTIWVKGWEQYYPKGYDDQDFTILMIKPAWVKAWYEGIHEKRL